MLLLRGGNCGYSTGGSFAGPIFDESSRGISQRDARRGSVAAKGFLLRHRKAVAVCAVALIILIGGVSVVRGLFNPERSAVSFFESYMNQDWAAVYQEIYLPEGAMLDETHFLQLAEEWETPEYLDYQVEQLSRGMRTASISITVLHIRHQAVQHLLKWM